MGAGGVRVGEMDWNVSTGGTRASTVELRAASHNALIESRILGGGYVFREGVGVLVHRSSHNMIRGNEIAHLGYTGISLGWEWGYAEPSGAGNNTVVENFIHHIGRWELCDMGGVYILGHSAGTLIESNVIIALRALTLVARRSVGTRHSICH